jgi:exonuclease 3'-5' domain-containing protein 1
MFDSLVSGLGKLGLEEGGDSAPTRVIDAFTDLTEDLNEAFSAATLIALDAEGVDLSRLGKVSIVQVSTPKCCFLVDVLDKDPADLLVVWLRGLLENPDIVKIIHDCRMDSDAMQHLLNIKLVNVHDTSCWHTAVSGQEDKNLNDALEYYGLRPNVFRDGSVYKTNPAFWATRPLTPQMVEWASGDVQCMFQLYQHQLKAATTLVADRARQSSLDFLEAASSADVGFVVAKNPGRFIGKRGANIRQLQRSSSTVIYNAPSTMQGYRRNMFMVFYRSEDALQSVERAASR